VATVSLHKHRGPGDVKFESARIAGPQGRRAGHRSATFTRRASTCCACRRMMNRVKAAVVFSVAGRIPTSR
jgi:hypothetical protein